MGTGAVRVLRTGPWRALAASARGAPLAMPCDEPFHPRPGRARGAPRRVRLGGGVHSGCSRRRLGENRTPDRIPLVKSTCKCAVKVRLGHAAAHGSGRRAGGGRTVADVGCVMVRTLFRALV